MLNLIDYNVNLFNFTDIDKINAAPPKFINRCRHLTALILDRHRDPFTNNLDLQNFQDLRKLSAEMCHLTAIPKNLNKLTNLEILNLNNNPITTLDGIEHLQKLKILRVNGTKSIDIDALNSLRNLEILSLNCREIVAISPIMGNTNLKELHLKESSIFTNIDELYKLTKLEHLNMSGLRSMGLFPLECKGLLQDIPKLRNLRYLNLRRLPLNDLPPTIGNLNMLETLNVSDCGLSRLPKEINTLKRLKYLDITDNLNLNTYLNDKPATKIGLLINRHFNNFLRITSHSNLEDTNAIYQHKWTYKNRTHFPETHAVILAIISAIGTEGRSPLNPYLPELNNDVILEILGFLKPSELIGHRHYDNQDHWKER